MDCFPRNLLSADWAIITAVMLVPPLMAFGIYVIRRGVRATRGAEAQFVELKTSRVQRQEWHRLRRSKGILNLLDDIEALLSIINTDDHCFSRWTGGPCAS